MKKLQLIALSLMTAASLSTMQAATASASNATDETSVTITETKTNWVKTLKKALIEPGIKLGIWTTVWLAGRIKMNNAGSRLLEDYDKWAKSSTYANYYNSNEHTFDTAKMSDGERIAHMLESNSFTQNPENISKTGAVLGWWSVSFVGNIGALVYAYKFLRKLYSEREEDVIQKNLLEETEA